MANETCSTYFTSHSNFSCQLILLRPFTCAKPVKPGRTSSGSRFPYSSFASIIVRKLIHAKNLLMIARTLLLENDRTSQFASHQNRNNHQNGAQNYNSKQGQDKIQSPFYKSPIHRSNSLS